MSDLEKQIIEERDRDFENYKPTYTVNAQDGSFLKIYEGRLKMSGRKFRMSEPSDIDDVLQKQSEGVSVLELIAEHIVTLERHKDEENFDKEPVMNWVTSKEYTPGVKVNYLQKLGGSEKAPLFFMWNYIMWSLSRDYFRPPEK